MLSPASVTEGIRAQAASRPVVWPFFRGVSRARSRPDLAQVWEIQGSRSAQRALSGLIPLEASSASNSGRPCSCP